MSKRRETDYYKVVKDKLEELFREQVKNTISQKIGKKSPVETVWEILRAIHLEITAKGSFSNEIKAKIPEGRDIIFWFLKGAPPDITGFLKKDRSVDFMVVEVKTEKIKLDDIYQAKKYGELFDARHAFLISLQPLPEEIKRLSKVVYSLLQLPAYKKLILAQFDGIRKEFVEWFPENPFER